MIPNNLTRIFTYGTGKTVAAVACAEHLLDISAKGIVQHNLSAKSLLDSGIVKRVRVEPVYISPRRLIDEKIQCTVFSTRQCTVINKKWGLIQKIALFNLEFEYTRQLYANWLNIMNSCNECPICFEVKKLHRLNCGHNVCKICLKEMLTRGASLHKCPLCREPIGKEHFAQYKIVYNASYTPSDGPIGQPLTARDLYNFRDRRNNFRDMGSTTDDEPIGHPLTALDLYNFHNMGTRHTISAVENQRAERLASIAINIVRDTLATLTDRRITENEIDLVAMSARVSRQDAERALIASGGILTQAIISFA